MRADWANAGGRDEKCDQNTSTHPGPRDIWSTFSMHLPSPCYSETGLVYPMLLAIGASSQ